MKVGLTLPNRGVLFGATTYEEMFRLAEHADRSDLFDGVWVGDSFLAKPRPESVTLLAGLASRTRRVRLGTACMASFVLRDPIWLAYQWASLDLMAQGRSVLVACSGLVEQPGATAEGELYRLSARDRVTRLVEGIDLIKRLWTEESVTVTGEHFRCREVRLEPKPAARPRPPIWIASNARGDRAGIDRAHWRVARHADGWQTVPVSPAPASEGMPTWSADAVEASTEFLAWRVSDVRQKVRELGRDPATFETQVYYDVNLNEDRGAAIEESQRFLETYYAPTRYPPDQVLTYVLAGPARECVERLRVLHAIGIEHVTLRIASWDQEGQFTRLVEDVLPRVATVADPARDLGSRSPRGDRPAALTRRGADEGES